MSSPMNFDSSFPFLSPSAETSYSSDDGDHLRTPFTDHAERDTFPQLFDQDSSYGGPDHSPSDQFHYDPKTEDDYQFSDLPLRALFPPSSVNGAKSQQHLISSDLSLGDQAAELSPSEEVAERDPFDAAFAVRNEERLIQAPLLVQTTFAEACRYSSRFPAGHLLNSTFMNMYDLREELGSGGYGFVMTAFRRADTREVAVKFIIKAKVSEHGWTEDEEYGKLPTEVMLLSFIEHEHIVECLDLFEDRYYFYLVQELHGCPWKSAPSPPNQEAPVFSSPPILSPSASEDSMSEAGPITPLQSSNDLLQIASEITTEPDSMDLSPSQHEPSQKPVPQDNIPPQFLRRASHDLFECIEQTPNKRLSEDQARHIFAQVVEAVHYLDSQGITHRDIKDENLVIDKNLKVKLIDFGSAVITDPSKPRPFYNLFFGTTAYASSEILRKKPYQAPPAEIWTLGVLLSYLLTGMSPFPTEKDAIDGRIVLVDTPGSKLSRACLNLMRRCLEPDPERRASIKEVRSHRWLRMYRD